MKKNLSKYLGTTLGLTFTLVSALPASAAPVTACYRWSGQFVNERTVLAVSDSLPLVTTGQTTSVAIGKEVGVCGFNTMAGSTGSVAIATTGTPTGSHLALNVSSVRVVSGSRCRPLDLDCTTTEQNRIPATWNCVIRNQQESLFNNITLTKITPDARCNLFQDGTAVLGSDPTASDPSVSDGNDVGPGNVPAEAGTGTPGTN